MACADWMLLRIGVNVSLLLGPGQKTNKRETEWEEARGSKSRARPNQTTRGTRHEADYAITCSDVIAQILICKYTHEKDRQTEAYTKQTQNNSNYFVTHVIFWAQWYNNLQQSWKKCCHFRCVRSGYRSEWSKTTPDVPDFSGSNHLTFEVVWIFLNCTTELSKVTVGF